MTKPVILTGVRANNDLHIGNYFGAILPIIDMARRRSAEYTVNLFIPDLHSFTTPIDHNQLFDSIMNNARVYAAAGLPLDDDAIQLYRQSYVPAHSELAVIMSNFTGFGEMRRMTQFKEKTKKLRSDPVFYERTDLEYKMHGTYSNYTSVGLFTYPILMAADILLYNATYVPVGDDQTQHLEFTRDIAERMNHKFGEVFTMPEPVLGKLLRIKDLQDPSKKMSKSDKTGKGVIFLNDTPDVARKKIMSAATDSLGRVRYDKAAQPGISNLLEILTLVRQANGRAVSLKQTIDEFTGLERYGDFKKIVADEMSEFLANFQARLAQVNDDTILRKLESSEITANQTANQTLLRVQKAIGLRR